MLGVNVDDNNPIISDVSSDKMEANWDMTSLGIDARIRSKSLCTAVVDKDRSSFGLRKTNLLK